MLDVRKVCPQASGHGFLGLRLYWSPWPGSRLLRISAFPPVSAGGWRAEPELAMLHSPDGLGGGGMSQHSPIYLPSTSMAKRTAVSDPPEVRPSGIFRWPGSGMQPWCAASSTFLVAGAGVALLSFG